MNCACNPVQNGNRTLQHPCFSSEAKHKYARIHLPVAPRCNISCNYCSRKFDCLHESRPGVTSEILSPEAAREKYDFVKDRVENLSVAGIAGPGEALANWDETRLTIEAIKKSDPQVIFCLSTNGLTLPHYAGKLVELGVRHVTVTVNCLEPEIGKRIYRYVDYQGRRYQGAEGAAILIGNQLAGIERLTGLGVAVKVNIVMIKGINDGHIPEIVKKVKELDVFMTNIMPLIPAKGSALEYLPQTPMKEVNKMRNICRDDLQQMYHCAQCRADAVGLLGEDRALEFSGLWSKQEILPKTGEQYRKQFKIAVASKTGRLIDQHFGHATEFAIYHVDGEAISLVEKRQIISYCKGIEEGENSERVKENTIGAIKDCHAVLSLRIGYHAKKRLSKHNVASIECYDTIENGLKYAVEKLVNKEAI
ncbi:nitrogenase cofactor biosynthesis protein NifB [Pelotomaculum terephthalicicum JT]|uniref:nitrogenase cofactor biosynthesis protein NifB n=1 Tax=Pelotomaculum TaxID=191373 RepID=UPI0009CB7BC6|nr:MULTISPECIES: nitrogenase cofactor biosynthesis protein NifB [Pelotomaculum]MCG9969741.1 nitrogenase cofactor biosynthesis protein NifB [Pelotomaculum terephthalicicum JT]OPX91327.1 MAG: FeMo cofactor biosynthesis protein NifB [Pelotomaculum sp. PtaB.Bin117]OPY61526.1 MAG: FeMo cofactor biosynthesis protein NifB [Pelotomaculum sp. PtaU1.Bin065]